MEKMNIDINLSGQEEGKFRKLYLVIGTLGLIYLMLMFLLPDVGLKHYYFSWIVFLPGFIEAILYGLGKKRIFADNFPYLKLNEERIEKSKGGLFAKPDIINWADVQYIEIKLFEIHLTTADNNLKKVDLTDLTDDNLKIVKEFVTTMKKSKRL